MSAKLIYYVYAYLRKDGTPFYIGKGYGRRAYEKHRKTLPKPHQIIFLETNLSEIGSLALERRMIRWYGRKDLGTGILLNRSDGGDGARQGPITRAKMSEAAKKRSQTLEGREKMRKLASWNSDPSNKEIKRQISLSNGSRPPSQKGKKGWNNGVVNTMSFESPGPEWVRGYLKRYS